MPDNPNQIPQLLHDAAPMVLGAFAAMIAVMLLISLLDRPYSSSHRDDARRPSRDAPLLRRRKKSSRRRRRKSGKGTAPSTER